MADRPDRTTMEGMIWNANHVLEEALKPDTNGISPTFFGDNLKAIIMLSVVEVGFIFSGNVGTGIMLVKQPDGSWSPPCAMGLSGMGWGLLVGGSIKDIIVFCYDDKSLDTLMSGLGLKFGGQAEWTLGPSDLGPRVGQVTLDLSKKGMGKTVSVAYSKGAFLGVSIEGSIAGTRDAVNSSFYGKEVTAKAVLTGEVPFPEGKVTLIDEVYDKLNKLKEGVTKNPDAEDEQKKAAAKSAADAAAEEANKASDVVKVDAAAEAAKEG